MVAFDSSIVFLIENQIKTAIWVVFLVIKLFALCDAAVRPNALFVAADKQTKLLWMGMLGGGWLFAWALCGVVWGWRGVGGGRGGGGLVRVGGAAGVVVRAGGQLEEDDC